MRKYLSTLHTRPEHHKRRFALLTSSIVTLFIFTIWSFVNFGTTGEVVAENSQENEVSPFESLRSNIASSFAAIGESFSQLKSGFNSPDLEKGYEELKGGALDTYGR